jgi:2-polyprenyl-3-methyl-5-hydroxy-6-metoxy-1,4-benzoquinol methylase
VERLKRIYSESYFRSVDSGSIGYDDYVADRAKISRTFHRRLEEIERWTGRKGKLLDVGCATGFSLEVAGERGWDAQGIEISEFACDFARRHLKLEVHCGSLADADLKAKTFDVITMWDCIEHCVDPVHELALANKALKPGGLLALTSPDIGSWPARLWGPRWMGIKDEEHLYYFSPETMERVLNKVGFEMTRAEHAGKYIDVGFFIKRTGLYSSVVEQALSNAARFLRLTDKVLYVNPFDIMLVYGRKTGGNA